MMTKEAFNALLKLIEEPPQQTFFVLCTTDPEKIPETVISRLVKVEFRRGSKFELISAALRVIKNEELKIEDEALELLTDVADGSFRNLHRLLNEVVLEKGEILGRSEVESFLCQRTGDYSPEQLALDMVQGNLEVILEKIEKMATGQVDFVGFNNRLLDYFHRLFLMVASGEMESGWTLADLRRWLVLLVEAIDRGRGVSIGQLALELALVDFMANIKDQRPKTKNEQTQVAEEIVKETTETIEVKMEPKEIVEKWVEILTAVRPYNHSIEAFLRATRPRELIGKKLTVEVFYPFHKEKLEEQRNRRVVEEVLKKVTGLELEFACVLAKNKIKPVVVDNGVETNKVVAGDDYEMAKQIFG
jgi:DNA polymerase-3 subunit gamma/tau